MHYSLVTKPVLKARDRCILCFLGLKENKYLVSTWISNNKNVNKLIFVHVDFYVTKCNSIVSFYFFMYMNVNIFRQVVNTCFVFRQLNILSKNVPYKPYCHWPMAAVTVARREHIP